LLVADRVALRSFSFINRSHVTRVAHAFFA
jgi:hypothetical protein